MQTNTIFGLSSRSVKLECLRSKDQLQSTRNAYFTATLLIPSEHRMAWRGAWHSMGKEEGRGDVATTTEARSNASLALPVSDAIGGSGPASAATMISMN